jgi:hypothetical protein
LNLLHVSGADPVQLRTSMTPMSIVLQPRSYEGSPQVLLTTTRSLSRQSGVAVALRNDVVVRDLGPEISRDECHNGAGRGKICSTPLQLDPESHEARIEATLTLSPGHSHFTREPSGTVGTRQSCVSVSGASREIVPSRRASVTLWESVRLSCRWDVSF